jgi:hypothetical protein
VGAGADVVDELRGVVVVVAPVVVSSVGVLGSVVVSLVVAVRLVDVVGVGVSDVAVGADDALAGATGPSTPLVVPAGVATAVGRT